MSAASGGWVGAPFETLRVSRAGAIAHVVIDHPEINLLDAAMLDDLERLSHACAADAELRVILFSSADPDFFIAHADLAGMLGRGDADAVRRERLSRFAEITERLRNLPAVTIAMVEGRTRGGGSELILALDLCYAAIETAVLSQPEVGMGLLPGGGATQRLPALVGRSRALEIILGAEDYDALTAERYGWITRALPRAELRSSVERLARRIASFSPEAIAAVKQAVEHSAAPSHEGLREEHRLFRRILASADTTERIERLLGQGGQTREYELDLARRLEE